MRWSLSRPEAGLLAFCLALLALALLAPPLAQPAHAHHFADQRALWGVPCALDVLSNLPFALGGLFGLAALRRVRSGALAPVQRACATLFFTGLLVTAVASGYYHWAPDDIGLAVDRAGMSVAFAGVLGLLVAAHVSERAGGTLAAALLVLAPASIAVWFAGSNVLPWALVQFGGIPLLLLFAFRSPRPGALAVRWIGVVAAYAVAKLFELNDAAVYEASGQLLSGHTLKHVAAAFAALPVIAAVAALPRGQNALHESSSSPRALRRA